jgi:hypothetical protein
LLAKTLDEFERFLNEEDKNILTEMKIIEKKLKFLEAVRRNINYFI